MFSCVTKTSPLPLSGLRHVARPYVVLELIFLVVPKTSGAPAGRDLGEGVCSVAVDGEDVQLVGAPVGHDGQVSAGPAEGDAVEDVDVVVPAVRRDRHGLHQRAVRPEHVDAGFLHRGDDQALGRVRGMDPERRVVRVVGADWLAVDRLSSSSGTLGMVAAYAVGASATMATADAPNASRKSDRAIFPPQTAARTTPPLVTSPPGR